MSSAPDLAGAGRPTSSILRPARRRWAAAAAGAAAAAALALAIVVPSASAQTQICGPHPTYGGFFCDLNDISGPLTEIANTVNTIVDAVLKPVTQAADTTVKTVGSFQIG